MKKALGMPLLGQKIHYKTEKGRIIKGIVARVYNSSSFAYVVMVVGDKKYKAVLRNNNQPTKMKWDDLLTS